MLEQIINMYIPEIAAIEAKTQQALKKSGGFTLSARNPLRKNENRLWASVLCLLAAQSAKNINTKAFQLAGLLHLFSYASYLHFAVPEELETKNFNNEVQYPVLVGDMLYCRVCEDVCRYNIQQYLDSLTSLIASVHKEFVQRDLKIEQNQAPDENELKFQAIISEGACYLGSHAVVGNSPVTETLKALGYNLGILKGVWEKELAFELYIDYWYKAWSLTEALPSGLGQSLFQQVLESLGSKWKLDRPRLLKESNA